ncbi:MAG: hypothetical protein E7163_03635 [Firmicutes bacterium]|nr:hypothetical protein [Bacillota bacterium]
MNNENNESLNSIPLGNMEHDNNISPVPLENSNDFNSIDETNEFINNNTEDINYVNEYDIPEPINNFNITPIFNDIGIVPPLEKNDNFSENLNENKPKKGINKTLFVIIIIISLFLVGSIVYFLLHNANSKATIITKEVSLEIGDEVSTNKNDYAIFKNVNSNNCSLDTSSVKDIKLGAKYTYKIICNNESYTGTLTVIDTKPPEVKTKKVTIGVNGNITAESFISECNDNSKKCFYKFENESKVMNHLKTPESYHVNIIVSDEAKNTTVVTVELIVSEDVPSLYLICTKDFEDYKITNKFGIVESMFNKYTNRTYEFHFDNQEEYNTFKDNNKDKEDVTYKNITGAPNYNDNNLILSINKEISYDDLNNEDDDIVPLNFGELKSFYQNKGYICKIGK